LECWSVGVLECWSVGVLECWSVGALERWSVGVLLIAIHQQLKVFGTLTPSPLSLFARAIKKGEGNRNPHPLAPLPFRTSHQKGRGVPEYARRRRTSVLVCRSYCRGSARRWPLLKGRSW